MSKPLDRLTLLETFVRIADAGSISAAARDLGLSQPSVSRQLAELESRFESQLIRRTTHSMALTQAGSALLTDARQLIDDWEALAEKQRANNNRIQGSLKIVAPIALGQLHLARLAWRFQLDHPDVTISWLLDDRPIRFSEVGCDCWIKIGAVPDETLVVRQLGSVERMLVCSPSFLDTHGTPNGPRAAERLPLLVLDAFERNRIRLTRGKKSAINIQPGVRLQTNNIFALKEAAMLGLGMAVVPRWFVTEELSNNELVDLLPAWRASSLALQVAYLPGRHQTLRLRRFLETLKTEVPLIAGIDTVD